MTDYVCIEKGEAITFHSAVNFLKTLNQLESSGITINDELVIPDSFQGNYS